MCADGSASPPPFGLTQVLFACKPKAVVCKEGEPEKPVDFFGCAAGGFPACANGLECADGTALDDKSVLTALFDEKCVCKDGKKPACVGGDAPKCPDGSVPDPKAGELPAFLRFCQDS